MSNQEPHIAREVLSHQAFLRRLAVGLVGEDADDLVQEMWQPTLERPPRGSHQLLGWLTGFTEAQLERHVANESTFEESKDAAKPIPRAANIRGVICGYRVEENGPPSSRTVRDPDKRVDELACRGAGQDPAVVGHGALAGRQHAPGEPVSRRSGRSRRVRE